MGLLGSYRRIFKQDYRPEIQQDIETLSVTVNDSFEAIYNNFNNQVTFQDNINCTLITFKVNINDKLVPNTPLVIKLNKYQNAVNGIIAINAVADDKVTLPTGGIFIAYTINNNITSSSNTTNQGNTASNPLTITVNSIKGLPINTNFSVTAIII